MFDDLRVVVGFKNFEAHRLKGKEWKKEKKKGEKKRKKENDERNNRKGRKLNIRYGKLEGKNYNYKK